MKTKSPLSNPQPIYAADVFDPDGYYVRSRPQKLEMESHIA